MTEMCFEPGATAQDVAEALRGLSARLSADTPVMAFGGRHAAAQWQAVFASGSIMRLFGATTLAALTAAISETRAAPAEQLRHLAETLPPGGPGAARRGCASKSMARGAR